MQENGTATSAAMTTTASSTETRVYSRVLLVVPPTGLYIREDRCQTPIENLHTVAPRPPVDLLYCAAMFRAEGCECRVKDYPVEGGDWDTYRADLAEFRPDLVMLSITSPSFKEDMKATIVAKQALPGVHVAAKGAHFHARDVEALEKYPALDLALRGEYEETCRDLVWMREREKIEGLTYRDETGRVRQNAMRQYVAELDSLPFPARDLVDNKLYPRPDFGVPQTTLVTERGCPHQCIYCLAPVFSGTKVRKRSPENVVAEIRECVEKYGIRDFLFRSDLFTADRVWVKKLCAALKEAKLDIRWSCNSRVDKIKEDLLVTMREVGCWLIAFGVESGSPELLDRMKKAATLDDARHAMATCRKVGMRSSIYILIGLPWETEETFRQGVDFAIELDPDYMEFFYVYPFEGTELRRIVEEEGLLPHGADPVAAYDKPSHGGLYLSHEQLEPLRRRALRRFYLRPGYIVRTLLANPSPRVLWNYVRYGSRQLADLVLHR